MDVALVNLLEGRSPTPPPSAAGAGGRLRDLWLAGVPLERAAAAAGLTVAEAEHRLAALGYGLMPGPRTAFEVEPLRRLYVDERLSAAEVADRLGWTEHQVRGRLRRAGIQRPPRVAAEQVRGLYEAGRSVRAVAAELGVHQRDVWRHLAAAGVARRPRGAPGVALSRRPLERLYVRDGLSLAEVARRFDVTADVVARNLDRYGIPRRRPPLERAVLEGLYVDERLGIKAVSARLGVSAAKIRADLAHHGIPVRRPGRPPAGAAG